MPKTALITGASGGIGRAFAEALARDGYTVTAVARSEDKLRQLTQQLGSEHDYVVADLSEAAGQDRVIARLGEQRFDLLINNAGVGIIGDFHDVPVDRTLAMLRLNIDALVRLSHAYLASARSGDALLNLSSTLSFVPMPHVGTYCASKSFVTAFSETLWFEQKKRGVYVMGLCPGLTKTDFQVRAGGRDEDQPASLFQTPEVVVERALAALARRKRPTVFTGSRNVLFTAFGRLMPRRPLITLMGNLNRPAER